MRSRHSVRVTVLPAPCGFLIAMLASVSVLGQAPQQTPRFGSPEEALKALVEASQAKNIDSLAKIFGPEVKELLSGDPVQDAAELEQFAATLQRGAKFALEGEDVAVLHVGAEGDSFPVPLIKEEGKWYFDTAEGKEEVLNRRVGENELRAIRVCRGYVAAQREYFAQDHDGDNVLEYAQRLASTAGSQDGLYWEAAADAPPSPLGPLVAQARAEGYARQNKDVEGATPYFGYVFRLLSRQGPNAPGGEVNYVINDNMIAGFALLAFPVDWGNSGVMTFLVGPNGVVLEKNLGEKTAEAVAGMTSFDPDATWSVAAP